MFAPSLNLCAYRPRLACPTRCLHRGGGFIVDRELDLSDSMTQYQQTIDMFTLSNLLALGLSLFVLILGKFTYQIMYRVRRGSDFRLIERIAGDADTDNGLDNGGYGSTRNLDSGTLVRGRPLRVVRTCLASPHARPSCLLRCVWN